jgi:hypothetical protein
VFPPQQLVSRCLLFLHKWRRFRPDREVDQEVDQADGGCSSHKHRCREEQFSFCLPTLSGLRHMLWGRILGVECCTVQLTAPIARDKNCLGRRLNSLR